MFNLTIMKVAYAVSIAEGWIPKHHKNDGIDDSISYTHHNPGNLRESEYEYANDGSFSIFSNDLVGFYALIRQLELYALGYNNKVMSSDTIEQAFSIYTNLSIGSIELDNYLSIIEKFSGVKRNEYISSII